MAKENEKLIHFGGSVKDLGNGKVGGHLVIFSDEDSPDLAGDFFTKETDFDLYEGKSIPVYYRHGFDKKLKTRKLGRATLKEDEVGIWLEAQLELRDEYEKAVYGMVQKEKLGWSSGAVNHLVVKQKVENSTWLKEWAIAEGSLTPMPFEPRTQAVTIKEYLEFIDEDSIPQTPDSKQISIKGIFEDVIERKYNNIYSLTDIFCSAIYKIQDMAYIANENGMTIDIQSLVDEALSEFGVRVKAMFKDSQTNMKSAFGLKFSERIDRASAAVNAAKEAAKDVKNLRLKDGRAKVISDERLAELKSINTDLSDLILSCEEVKEGQIVPFDATKHALSAIANLQSLQVKHLTVKTE